jgi:hypothetical protein
MSGKLEVVVFWQTDKNVKCGGLPMKLPEAHCIFLPRTPLGRGELQTHLTQGVLVQISAVRRILYLNTSWNSLHWKEENINHTYTRYTYYTGPRPSGYRTHAPHEIPSWHRWVPLAKHIWGPHGWFPDIPVCPDGRHLCVNNGAKTVWVPDGWSRAHMGISSLLHTVIHPVDTQWRPQTGWPI